MGMTYDFFHKNIFLEAVRLCAVSLISGVKATVAAKQQRCIMCSKTPPVPRCRGRPSVCRAAFPTLRTLRGTVKWR